MCGMTDLPTEHMFIPHAREFGLRRSVKLILFRNLEASEVPVYSVKGHKEIINSIDGVGGLGIGEGAPEIVTGSRDGEFAVITNSCVVLLS